MAFGLSRCGRSHVAVCQQTTKEDIADCQAGDVLAEARKLSVNDTACHAVCAVPTVSLVFVLLLPYSLLMSKIWNS